MDILKLLKQDHDNVNELFSKIFSKEASFSNERAELFMKISTALMFHAKIEEKIFYPVVEKYKETRDLTLEAYEEHDLIKTLIHEINETDERGEKWMAKLTVLRENVQHHVKEEENKLFPKVKKIIEPEVLEKMGLEMLSMKVKGN